MSTLTEELVLEKEETDIEKMIILYNDDVNTFDHVITCLIKYCDHNKEQANQCALIIHTKGKIDVKPGDFDTLEPICTALTDHGLNANIE